MSDSAKLSQEAIKKAEIFELAAEFIEEGESSKGPSLSGPSSRAARAALERLTKLDAPLEPLDVNATAVTVVPLGRERSRSDSSLLPSRKAEEDASLPLALLSSARVHSYDCIDLFFKSAMDKESLLHTFQSIAVDHSMRLRRESFVSSVDLTESDDSSTASSGWGSWISSTVASLTSGLSADRGSYDLEDIWGPRLMRKAITLKVRHAVTYFKAVCEASSISIDEVIGQLQRMLATRDVLRAATGVVDKEGFEESLCSILQQISKEDYRSLQVYKSYNEFLEIALEAKSDYGVNFQNFFLSRLDLSSVAAVESATTGWDRDEFRKVLSIVALLIEAFTNGHSLKSFGYSLVQKALNYRGSYLEEGGLELLESRRDLPLSEVLNRDSIGVLNHFLLDYTDKKLSNRVSEGLGFDIDDIGRSFALTNLDWVERYGSGKTERRLKYIRLGRVITLSKVDGSVEVAPGLKSIVHSATIKGERLGGFLVYDPSSRNSSILEGLKNLAIYSALNPSFFYALLPVRGDLVNRAGDFVKTRTLAELKACFKEHLLSSESGIVLSANISDETACRALDATLDAVQEDFFIDKKATSALSNAEYSAFLQFMYLYLQKFICFSENGGNAFFESLTPEEGAQPLIALAYHLNQIQTASDYESSKSKDDVRVALHFNSTDFRQGGIAKALVRPGQLAAFHYLDRLDRKEESDLALQRRSFIIEKEALEAAAGAGQGKEDTLPRALLAGVLEPLSAAVYSKEDLVCRVVELSSYEDVLSLIDLDERVITGFVPKFLLETKNSTLSREEGLTHLPHQFCRDVKGDLFYSINGMSLDSVEDRDNRARVIHRTVLSVVMSEEKAINTLRLMDQSIFSELMLKLGKKFPHKLLTKGRELVLIPTRFEEGKNDTRPQVYFKSFIDSTGTFKPTISITQKFDYVLIDPSAAQPTRVLTKVEGHLELNCDTGAARIFQVQKSVED